MKSSSATASPPSLLLDPERHPLWPADTAATLGTVVVLAPHPDDESLGCGGLLALLASTPTPAHVIVMTDGSRSHPQSCDYPAERLAALREKETLDALEALGCSPNCATFLRFGDCALPGEESATFTAAAARLRETLATLAPDTLVVPWRRDPHCDHEATWSLARAAAADLTPRPRWLEYPVWAWPRAADPTDAVPPRAGEAAAWRLDISSVLPRKQQAIAQHRSQLGAVIRDDPSGFVLEPAMLAYFARPWELYLAPHHV